MNNEFVLELHIVVRDCDFVLLKNMEEKINDVVFHSGMLNTQYEIGGGIRREEEDHGENIG